MTPEKPSDPLPQFMEWKGLKLSYSDEGQGDQVIVAIPGLPGSLRDFRWLAPALPKSIRFIRIALPGFGESERSGYRGMTLEERSEPVLALIQHLGLQSVSLLSHSSGSTVIAYLARQHPELVESLIYLSPAGPVAHYPVALVRFVGRFMAWRLSRGLLFPINRFLFKQLGFPSYLTDHERCYATLDAGVTRFKDHRANILAQKQPALVAWGREDKISPPKFTKALGDLIERGPRCEFEDGGHAIQKSHAVELGTAIEKFMLGE